MTGALKVMSVERGLDPRDFALAAFGGAGPVHGADLMRSLGAACLLVPRYPGILCALGLLTTDLRYDFAITRVQRAGEFDCAATADIFDDLAGQADRRLAADGVPPERRRYRRAADMRYARQGVELTVGLGNGPVSGTALETLVHDFHALHERLYTFSDHAAPVEIVTLRLEAVGSSGRFALPEIPAARSERPDPAGFAPSASMTARRSGSPPTGAKRCWRIMWCPAPRSSTSSTRPSSSRRDSMRGPDPVRNPGHHGGCRLHGGRRHHGE